MNRSTSQRIVVDSSAGLVLVGCPYRYELSFGSTAVADSAIRELDQTCVGLSLAGLVGLTAVGELYQRLLVAACALCVGVTAVEKCRHGVFNQAGSGPRSMA